MGRLGRLDEHFIHTNLIRNLDILIIYCEQPIGENIHSECVNHLKKRDTNDSDVISFHVIHMHIYHGSYKVQKELWVPLLYFDVMALEILGKRRHSINVLKYLNIQEGCSYHLKNLLSFVSFCNPKNHNFTETVFHS